MKKIVFFICLALSYNTFAQTRGELNLGNPNNPLNRNLTDEQRTAFIYNNNPETRGEARLGDPNNPANQAYLREQRAQQNTTPQNQNANFVPRPIPPFRGDRTTRRALEDGWQRLVDLGILGPADMQGFGQGQPQRTEPRTNNHPSNQYYYNRAIDDPVFLQEMIRSQRKITIAAYLLNPLHENYSRLPILDRIWNESANTINFNNFYAALNEQSSHNPLNTYIPEPDKPKPVYFDLTDIALREMIIQDRPLTLNNSISTEPITDQQMIAKLNELIDELALDTQTMNNDYSRDEMLKNFYKRGEFITFDMGLIGGGGYRYDFELLDENLKIKVFKELMVRKKLTLEKTHSYNLDYFLTSSQIATVLTQICKGVNAKYVFDYPGKKTPYNKLELISKIISYPYDGEGCFVSYMKEFYLSGTVPQLRSFDVDKIILWSEKVYSGTLELGLDRSDDNYREILPDLFMTESDNLYINCNQDQTQAMADRFILAYDFAQNLVQEFKKITLHFMGEQGRLAPLIEPDDNYTTTFISQNFKWNNRAFTIPEAMKLYKAHILKVDYNDSEPNNNHQDALAIQATVALLEQLLQQNAFLDSLCSSKNITKTGEITLLRKIHLAHYGSEILERLLSDHKSEFEKPDVKFDGVSLMDVLTSAPPANMALLEATFTRIERNPQAGTQILDHRKIVLKERLRTFLWKEFDKQIQNKPGPSRQAAVAFIVNDFKYKAPNSQEIISFSSDTALKIAQDTLKI